MTTDLQRTAVALGQVAARMPDAKRRLEQHAPGFPGGGSEPAAPSSADSTQPERLAGSVAHDPALRDLARIDGLAAEIAHKVSVLRAIVNRWAEPRHGVSADGDLDDDGWCRSCRRVRLWVPAERAGLCGWCRRFRALHLRLPPVELVEARKAGRRVTQRMVDDAIRRDMAGSHGPGATRP